MNITCLHDSHDEAAWEQFVHNHPGACGYHPVAWGSLIKRVFGHTSYYLMARDQAGGVRGVLPLVYMQSPLFGRFLTSMPFFNYGGVLADSSEARAALLDAAAEKAQGLHATHIELRQAEPLDIEWPVRSHKVSMRLELPQRYEELLKAFPSKLRSQVRRGEKDGLTVKLGGIELLNDFYRVFSRNMRDLGTPVYSKEFFAEILQVFSKDARICAVYLSGQPVAAGFVYGFRHTLEIPWASSDRRYARLAPNMSLYSAVLQYACTAGYREFDFGRSTVNSGTYRFKEQWGAKPCPLYWYYWLPTGAQLPELNPQNPKYQLAIRMWQQLPVALTQFAGPMIVKYLP